MENKLTDEQIIRALECCTTADSIADCMKLKCPMYTRYGCTYYLNTGDDGEHTICREQFKSALDLINRQKAEIERLREGNKEQKAIIEAIEDSLYPLPFETDFSVAIKKAKSIAIKKFAERLKSVLIMYTYQNFDGVIDNLVKEMVGE